MHVRDLGDALEWRAHGETLRIEPWGPDALRVRVTYGGPLVDDLPGALLDAPPPGGKAQISVTAPLERIPLFLRDDAQLPVRSQS